MDKNKDNNFSEFRDQLIEIERQYTAKFGSCEAGHPSILFRPEFAALQQKAIVRGTPLTQKEVEAVFGALRWDW